jgi:hypothetical protein
MSKRYTIVKLHRDGKRDPSKPQPAGVFGPTAETGMAQTTLARKVWALVPKAHLNVANVAAWPQNVNKSFYAKEES